MWTKREYSYNLEMWFCHLSLILWEQDSLCINWKHGLSDTAVKTEHTIILRVLMGKENCLSELNPSGEMTYRNKPIRRRNEHRNETLRRPWFTNHTVLVSLACAGLWSQRNVIICYSESLNCSESYIVLKMIPFWNCDFTLTSKGTGLMKPWF